MEYKKDNNQDPSKTVENNEFLNVLFKDDPHFEFIYKKTEKIVSAVYLISNLIDREEPLKWELRAKSLTLLPKLASLRYLRGALFQEKFDEARLSFLELISLFKIGLSAGYISEMNYGIMKYEIEAALSLIHERGDQKDRGGSVSISPDFFKVEGGPLPLLSHTAPASPLKTHKGHNVLYNPPKASKSSTAQMENIKDNALSKDERKAKILDMLRIKSNLTIKDFSQVITDCSEKTIQRILLQLVAQGVLKKEGERRWSTYSLSV